MSVVSPGGPWMTALSCTLAPLADDHRRVVGADDRAVPDRRALLDDDVADERRGRRDERARVHLRRQALEREERHVVGSLEERARDRDRGPGGVTFDHQVGIGSSSADARTPGSIRRPSP